MSNPFKTLETPDVEPPQSIKDGVQGNLDILRDNAELVNLFFGKAGDMLSDLADNIAQAKASKEQKD